MHPGSGRVHRACGPDRGLWLIASRLRTNRSGSRATTARGVPVITPQSSFRGEEIAVDLTVWVPVTVLLGLATLGLMFAFLEACDKV